MITEKNMTRTQTLLKFTYKYLGVRLRMILLCVQAKSQLLSGDKSSRSVIAGMPSSACICTTEGHYAQIQDQSARAWDVTGHLPPVITVAVTVGFKVIRLLFPVRVRHIEVKVRFIRVRVKD